MYTTSRTSLSAPDRYRPALAERKAILKQSMTLVYCT